MYLITLFVLYNKYIIMYEVEAKRKIYQNKTK